MEDSAALPPTARRRPRWGMLALVVLFHLLVLAGLVRAFAPDLTAAAVEKAVSILTVTISAPREEPSKPPEQKAEPDSGAAGAAGSKATPRETSAPKAAVPLKPAAPIPPAASTGTAAQSGAQEAGIGSGGAAAGLGTGSGQGGNGQGGNGQGGGARKLEKLAGDINSAKDYPKKSRDLRIGHSVTILLSVGTDGRVTNCAITAPSPDPEADRITCALASERFRFRPATNASGEPVAGKYAWRQRWYY